MTRQEQLEAIRAACIRANPEIEGKHVFEVGTDRCKFCGVERVVRDRKVHNRIVDEKTGGSSQEVEVTEYNMEGGPCPKHFSRLIRLADVLEAARKVGYGSTEDWLGVITGVVTRYDLRNDDVTLQSDPCVAFLYELLK